MAETADRIQVEFSTNAKELIQQLKNLSGSIDTIVNDLEDMEGVSETAAKEEKNLSEQSKKVTLAHKEGTEAIVENTKKKKEAKEETKSYTGALDEMKEAGNKAKEMFGKLSGVLGLFGVSVGIGELINQVKQLGEQAKAAYDEMKKLEQKTSYQFALTYSQQAVVSSYGYQTSTNYGISKDTSENIYAALMTVYPELEKDTEQLQKMANTFASISAIEGMEDMTSFITQFFVLTKKYGMEDYGQMINYLTTLEAVSQKTPALTAESLLQTATESDKSASYMNMTPEDVLYYIGSSYQQGEGIESQEFMLSIEDVVLRYWKAYLEKLATSNPDIDTSAMGEAEMKLWWETILKDMPATEAEIFNYLSQQGFRAGDASTIAKGILASGGDEQFRNLIAEITTEVYKGSLEEYRKSTLTGTDYQVISETAKQQANANLVNQGGLFGWLGEIDQRNAARNVAWTSAKEIMATNYDVGAMFAGQIYEAESKTGDEFTRRMSEVTNAMTEYLKTSRIQVNVEVKTNDAYQVISASAKTQTGNQASDAYNAY